MTLLAMIPGRQAISFPSVLGLNLARQWFNLGLRVILDLLLAGQKTCHLTVVNGTFSQARQPCGRGLTQTILGINIKYGLAGNLTLDVTINPNFGQVESDPAPANLGAIPSSTSRLAPFIRNASVARCRGTRSHEETTWSPGRDDFQIAENCLAKPNQDGQLASYMPLLPKKQPT